MVVYYMFCQVLSWFFRWFGVNFVSIVIVIVKLMLYVILMKKWFVRIVLKLGVNIISSVLIIDSSFVVISGCMWFQWLVIQLLIGLNVIVIYDVNDVIYVICVVDRCNLCVIGLRLVFNVELENVLRNSLLSDSYQMSFVLFVILGCVLRKEMMFLML